MDKTPPEAIDSGAGVQFPRPAASLDYAVPALETSCSGGFATSPEVGLYCRQSHCPGSVKSSHQAAAAEFQPLSSTSENST
jgi:hypothetical protein